MYLYNILAIFFQKHSICTNILAKIFQAFMVFRKIVIIEFVIFTLILNGEFMSNQTVHFKNIRAKIIETLETANSEVLIAVAWLTDEKIIKVLNDLSLNGISISIIFYDDRINNKDLFKTLYYRKANINVSKKLMHNKFCIIDREIVINGSYNWTYNASTNDENIQITKHNDELVDSFVEQFYELKEKM